MASRVLGFKSRILLSYILSLQILFTFPIEPTVQFLSQGKQEPVRQVED